MAKTEKTKCPKCRKKVEAEIKDEGELICPICSKSLGFVTANNLFLEMVQVYLDYKKINAIATINEDGLLDIEINFDKEDHQILADLLSECMPISYVITNTAVIKNVDRRAGKRTSTNIGKGKKKKPRNLKSVGRRRIRKKKDFQTSNNLESYL